MIPEDLQTLKTMTKYGGGFIKALAQAAYHADSINLAKIKNTWLEDWAKYTEMAKSLNRHDVDN